MHVFLIDAYYFLVFEKFKVVRFSGAKAEFFPVRIIYS